MIWRGSLGIIAMALVLSTYADVVAQGSVAFTSFSPGDPVAGIFPRIEKHVLELDGGVLVVVDEFPYETLGFGRYGGPFYWSPDKSRAITFSDKGVFVTDASGGNEVLIASSGTEGAPDPRWSPDGTKIVLSLGPRGRRQIHLVGSNGDNLINLSNSTSDDFLPYWSPDGKQIIFTSSQGLDSDVYVMDAEGSNRANLTNFPDADYLASWSPQGPWSPDGTQILFLSYRNGNSDIFVMNRDGGNPTNLTESVDSEDSPIWSPDGARIAYVVQYLGAGGLILGDIFMMDSKGGSQVNLTNSASESDQNPFWIGGSPASVIEAQSWGEVKSIFRRD